MPTLRMEEQVQQPSVDEAMAPGKHGRDKRFRIENAFVNHKIPRIDNGRWVIPKDAFPSIRKGWYVKNNASFVLTVVYQVCCVCAAVERFLGNDGKANETHVIFSLSDKDRAKHAMFVRSEIFNGTGPNGFVAFANHALNQSIRDLTKDQWNGQDFKISEQVPRTKDDVMKLLFDKDGSCMNAIEERSTNWQWRKYSSLQAA